MWWPVNFLVPARLVQTALCGRPWALLSSVLWPWQVACLGLLGSIPGAQRSPLPSPSVLPCLPPLWGSRQGCWREAGTTQLSLLCQLSQSLQGTQGGGQQDQDNQLEPPVFPGGMMPRANGPSTASRTWAPNVASWLLSCGFEGDPSRPLICT